MLDLRVPSGCFFAMVGALLVAMGFFNPTVPNVNLAAGGAMLAFGLYLLVLAFRKRQ